MVANAQMLSKPDVVAYVGANASRFDIDPAALLAVANHEGLNQEPGKTWVLPNEGGSFNFGPPSWNSGWAGHPAAGTPIVQQQGASAAYWAWTPAGLDYWMEVVSKSAAGLRGNQAIAAIVNGFERPREDLAAGEIINASKDYNSFQQQIQNPLPGVIQIPSIGDPGVTDVPIPGQTKPGQLPTPTNPQAKPPAQTTTGAKFSLHLFDLPTGPVNLTLPWDFSGILLFLAALFAIIIGALLWKPSRSAIVNVGAGAALA